MPYNVLEGNGCSGLQATVKMANERILPAGVREMLAILAERFPSCLSPVGRNDERLFNQVAFQATLSYMVQFKKD